MLKSLGKKFTLIVGIFIALMAGNTLLTEYHLGKQETDAGIINLAGQQQMLPEHMSKEVLEIMREHSLEDRAKHFGELRDNITSFEKGLNALRNGDARRGIERVEDDNIIQSLATVEELWGSFKKSVETILQIESEKRGEQLAAVAHISAHNMELLQACDRVVKALVKENDKSLSPNVVNIAGRQRMLSQKMTKELFIMLEQSGDERVATNEQLAATIVAFEDGLKTLKSNDLGIANVPLSVVIGQWRDFRLHWDAIARFETEHQPEIERAMEHIIKQSTVLLGATHDLVDHYSAWSKARIVHLENLLWVAVVLSVMVAIAILIYISKTIITALKQALGILESVADGDLTQELDVSSNDEVGRMASALNTSLAAIGNSLLRVQAAAKQMSGGANQVSRTSQAISQGATEQAASLEEISASMTQLSDQTQQNAAHSVEASQLAKVATQQAEEGNEMMKEMVTAMGDIESSSQNISRIIKVIDEIAFQTNLLALNAAIEAARAGAHGKGFAVVAEEVRGLAARSASAAKETTALIEGSIDRVNAGTQIANRTADALNGIVNDINKASNLAGEIASSCNEQAAGINQIKEGLRQLDTVTQENTASSEESAAAAVALSDQATHLVETLKQFKLADGEEPEAADAGTFIGDMQPAETTEEPQALTPMTAPAPQHAPAPKPELAPALDDIIPMDDADMGRY